MSRAHIFMTRTDPYPSQQTVTPPKFCPVPSPAHEEDSVYFAIKHVHRTNFGKLSWCQSNFF